MFLWSLDLALLSVNYFASEFENWLFLLLHSSLQNEAVLKACSEKPQISTAAVDGGGEKTAEVATN